MFAILALAQAAWLADARRLMLVNVLLVLLIVGAAAAIVFTLLRRSVRQRVAAARLAAMGTATARILHQVKNPLQTILLHAEMLGEAELVADEAVRGEVAAAIVSEATRMSNLLGELSAYASGVARRLDLVPIPLHDLVRDVVERLGREAERDGITLAIARLDRVWIGGDAYFLRQALENVVRNAREALGERSAPGAARLGVSLRRRGGEVVIEVRDNGPGMDPEHARTAFEPFVTTKGKGMGLGLPICRDIIEGHGGRVELRTRPGVGTAVRLILPVCPAPADAAAPADPGQAAATSRA
ncbi:MAG TPA: HAMP domain-containing sensor histidine kinase [Longimicrobiales bacterium]